MKELSDWSDEQVITIILNDRRNSCTNMYAPLPQRIGKILGKLETTRLMPIGRGK
jgi:hypothetical protein